MRWRSRLTDASDPCTSSRHVVVIRHFRGSSMRFWISLKFMPCISHTCDGGHLGACEMLSKSCERSGHSVLLRPTLCKRGSGRMLLQPGEGERYDETPAIEVGGLENGLVLPCADHPRPAPEPSQAIRPRGWRFEAEARVCLRRMQPDVDRLETATKEAKCRISARSPSVEGASAADHPPARPKRPYVVEPEEKRSGR